MRRIPTCILLAILPAVCRAQQSLDEITVTAEREKTPSAPPSQGATNGDDMLNLLSAEPNTQTGKGPDSIFSLRGISQEGTRTNIGTRSNPAVQVTVGNVPRSSNVLWTFGTPAWDMRSFEVQRGPVLFAAGPAAEGGALRFVPNAPAFIHEGAFTAEMGGFDSYRFGLTENMVLIPDKLALRLNGYTEGNDGSVTNIALDDDEFQSVERELFRSALRWRPAGNDEAVFDLTFETERGRGNALGLATTLPGGDFFDRETALNTREETPVDKYVVNAAGKVELADGKWIEGEVAWQEAHGYQLGDFDGTPFVDWFFRALVREQRLTGGTRLNGVGEGMAWTLGLYAESSDYHSAFKGTGLAPFPAGSRFSSKLDEDVDIAALFGHGEYRFAPGWWMTGGLRLDYQERNLRSSAVFGGMPRGADRLEIRSTEWLPEAGVEWRGEEAKAGLKIARSYRPAGAGYAALLGQVMPYGAERGWEGNLYAEKRWKGFTAEGRVFYARLEGQQLAYIVPGGMPVLDQFIANAGRSTRAGAEVELEWKGPGAFIAGLSGGYLYTRFDELTLNGIDRSGQKLSASPELNAGLRLAWSPATGCFVETMLTWSDVSYAQVDSPEATALEKRLLLSARIGYRWRNAEVYAFGTNLLDEDFALTRLDYSPGGGGVDGAPNMPRCLGVGMALKW